MATEDKQNGEVEDALEVELERKRGEWKRTHERSRVVRQLSLLLAAMILAGAMVALFFAFNRLNQQRTERTNASPAETP